MKIKLILIAIAICLSAIATAAQTIVITPKKTIYRRPKPQQDGKKTFAVRRPVAKASTAALSKRITSAISPEKALALNIREEMTEYQWLEEADYKVLFNQNGVLCVELWMMGTAAYPDSVTKRVVVNSATGATVRPSDVFRNLPALARMLKTTQAAEVAAAKQEMKSDPDARPEELFSETDFTVKDFKEFSVNTKGVTFYYDYGFPHVIEALQPNGEYHYSWAQIKPFVRMDSMSQRKIRVLVAKPGLDGHDRGAKVIARALRDAGMEVIYTGLRQTPEMIASAALQEDVDAVGISILSGAHKTLCPRIVDLLHENGMNDTLVLVGGIVPTEDIPDLKSKGVSEVFLPGTSTEDIVKFINENVRG
jgi:methylmalonyl-CoA mutase, C-terminal domain